MAKRPTTRRRTQRFPAKYWLLKLETKRGDLVDFTGADWEIMFVPRTDRIADLVTLPARWAYTGRRDRSLVDVTRGWRPPLELSAVWYSIHVFDGDRVHIAPFHHPFRPGTTFLHRDRIQTRGTNKLFVTEDLNFLMESRKFRGKKAIQFIS